MKKRFCSALLCALLVLMQVLPYANAVAVDQATVTSVEKIIPEDGSYIVTEIRESCSIGQIKTSLQTKSGTKTSKVYSTTGTLLYTLTVSGSFTYNGTTANAVSSSYSYTVDASLWSFSGGSSSCAGATATATGTFKYLFQSKSLTVSLTCSPSGTLS